jgi:hypothetical protein
MAITWEPYFLTPMWIGTIPCGFIFLIKWRIARRFGGRGLAVVASGAGLPLYGNLPGVGRLRARACSRVCNFCGVCHLGDIGPRNDAAGRRPCPGRPAGAPAVGTGLMLRRLKMGPRTTFRRLCQDDGLTFHNPGKVKVCRLSSRKGAVLLHLNYICDGIHQAIVNRAWRALGHPQHDGLEQKNES